MRRPVRNAAALSNRRYQIALSETLTFHESLSIKQRRPGVKKPLVEATEGDSYHRDSGTWSKLLQRIDRTVRPHRYTKKVVGEDGTVYKDVDVPLGDQSAHGLQGRVRHDWVPDPAADENADSEVVRHVDATAPAPHFAETNGDQTTDKFDNAALTWRRFDPGADYTPDERRSRNHRIHRTAGMSCLALRA